MANFTEIIDEKQIDNPLEAKEEVIVNRDPLKLDLDDKVFIKVANKLIKDSNNFFNTKYNLKERRKENEKYLFGRQLDDQKLKPYNARYTDNIIYESMAYIKPIALSRMPDIIVKPGSDQPESKQVAKDISKVVSTDIQSRERRRVLGMAFKHLPVYFVGIIKYFWNPEKGKDGDYDFKVVHPENLVVDHTAASNDANDMNFVAEAVEYSVKELLIRFPDKKEELFTELRATSIFTDNVNEKTEDGLNTKVKIWEIWFTWYDKAKNQDSEDVEFERIEGVAWFYKNCLLKKMKNPNWDWEGEPRTFSYDEPVGLDAIQESVMTGDEIPGLRQETIFHNHFENPEKPYIFLGYDQWGKTPIDETSPIEQVLRLQENVDKRGKQITEMLDRSRGKHIFTTDSGLKKEDIEELDMSNPEEDLLIDGDVSRVHSFMPGEQPQIPMVQNLSETRERIFDKMGVSAAIRGQVSNSAATNTQIAREGDFTRADDLTDDTVNYAAEKMANAILQMIKLRYTKEHFRKLLGADGDIVFTKITRDMIEDGMEVSISASGVDKLKSEQRAMDMAKMQMTDPMTFYQDLNMSDPRGRTEKLMLFMTQPNMYLTKFILSQDDMQATTEQNAANLNGVAPDTGAQEATQAIMQIQQGQVPPMPAQVSPAYLQTITAFANSPEIEAVLQQFPDQSQAILAFLKQVASMGEQGQQTEAPVAPPAPNGIGQAPVGPITNNPQPGDTSKVNILPPTGG